MSTKRTISDFALDPGSTKRLLNFQKSLSHSRHDRNWDKDMVDFMYVYVKRQFSEILEDTVSYLKCLRSKKDGELFSQGFYSYDKLRENVSGFQTSNHAPFNWNRNYQSALDELVRIFEVADLQPLEYTCDRDIRRHLPKEDTNAGWTWINTGLRTKGENMEGSFEKWLIFVEQGIRAGTFNRPILPWYRTQGKGHAFTSDGKKTNDCDHKTRLISMVDLFVIITENRFARPIQQFMATLKWYAGGKELSTQLASIITHLRTKFHHWVSLDYSAYDQSISAWLIRDAFKVIRAAFKNLSERDRQVMDVIEHDFIYKGFVLDDGIHWACKGVPSGSMWTQIVDSIVNYLMIRTYLDAKGSEGEMLLMGDDNLLYTFDQIDVDDLSSYLAHNFGVNVNPSKTDHGSARQNPTFLSSEWMPEGRNREYHEVLAKMMYPERRRFYSKGRAKVEEVFYSYYLAYNIPMSKVFDIGQFLREYPNLKTISLNELGSRGYIPGHLHYLMNYSGGWWEKQGRFHG